MATNYGPDWTIIPEVLRYTPNYDPTLLIHVESAGLDDTTRYYNQAIYIKGSLVVNSTSPRSYRATRLYMTASGWAATSNGYDVYGSSANASALLTFLQTFNANDILVLNTYDEPLNNRGVFQSELINSFKAGLQTSPVWASRCSYQLIASKSKGVIYENIKPRYSPVGINTTLYLG